MLITGKLAQLKVSVEPLTAENEANKVALMKIERQIEQLALLTAKLRAPL